MGAFDRYKTQETSFEVRVRTGLVFEPRFYCDDDSFSAIPDDIKPYLRKSPVAKLSVVPRVQFVNTDLVWDISQSTSATSTLNTFSVFFNGSPTDIITADWAVDPLTATIQYDTVADYVVEAFVIDILGNRSQTNSIMVRIIDETEQAYIGTTDSGVYVLLPGFDPVQSNFGLSGVQLNVRALRLNPHYRDLPVLQQHIWIATEDGVSFSTDGAANWSNISEATLGTPENAAADVTPPTASDPDNIDITFDPQDASIVHLLRTTSTRSWLYTSTDYGVTWGNEQISIAV